MHSVFLSLYLQKKERMESLKQRRTIRKYQQKDISSDLLNDLLETACRASTVGNMQVYSVIVTRDADRKAKLAPAHFNQPMVQTAPVVLTFCIDLRRFSKWPCLIMLTILWVVLELHLQIYCFVIAVVRLFVLDP